MFNITGYASNSEGLCASVYDTDPQTFTLLAKDRHGREAGTISLVFDSASRVNHDHTAFFICSGKCFTLLHGRWRLALFKKERGHN